MCVCVRVCVCVLVCVFDRTPGLSRYVEPFFFFSLELFHECSQLRVVGSETAVITVVAINTQLVHQLIPLERAERDV